MEFIGSSPGVRSDSASNAGSGGARGGRALRTNALAREGITAANASAIGASRTPAALGKPITRRDASTVSYHPGYILPQREWKSFGDGWIQVTSSDSGQRTKFGLHTVIESATRRVFMCCYVPYSDGAYQMMTGQNPSYDIEVSSKAMTLHEKTAPEFIIILGFTSAARHVRIKCSTAERTWSLIVYRDGKEELIAQVFIESIRTNVFHDMFIQVRGDFITLDVDGMPIFTTVKLPYPSCLAGFVGVLAADSKCALKNWKFREGEASSRRDILSSEAVDSTSSVHRADRESSSNASSVRAPSAPSMPRDGGLTHAQSPMRGSRLAASSDADTQNEVTNGKSKKTQMKSLSELLGTRPTGGAPPDAPTTALVNFNVPTWVVSKGNSANITAQPSDSAERMKNALTSDIPDAGAGAPGRRDVISEMTEGEEFNNKAAYEGQSQSDKLQEVSSQLCSRHIKSIVDTVLRDVIQHDLGVTFDDIASVANAKRLLNEAVVLPMIMPEFFTGIREPWKGVLLFGPPGTGKTMLAKAAAGVNGSTFFSCSASSLISKYRGESEKIVRCLFEAARLLAPSVIFMDEIDALVSSRGADGEHEASRRLKTELFSQLDGVASSSSQGVMLLATTNCPWDLDEAMRRRLEKRIYIPLPDRVGRIELFDICLRKIDVDRDHVDLSALASLTEGHSGADIRIICRDAAMMPMRRLLAENAPEDIARMRNRGALVVSKVNMQDFVESIRNTNSSVSSQFIRRYEEWDREFGSR